MLWMVFGGILLRLDGLQGFGFFIGLSLLLVLVDLYAAKFLRRRVSTGIVMSCLVGISITAVSGMILVAVLRGADAVLDMPHWAYYGLVLGFVLPARVAAVFSARPRWEPAPFQPLPPDRGA
jgi:hypothetical protein